MNFLCAVLLMLVWAVPGALCRDNYTLIRVDSCAGNQKLRVDSVHLWPLPIGFPSLMNADIKGAILEPVNGPLTLQVKVFAKVFMFWARFPLCIEDFGSCTFDDACTRLPPNCGLTSCTCPIVAETFNVPFRDVPIPSLPSIVQWAAKGHYKVELRSYEAGRIVSCHRGFIHI